jgi:hypothetical protein
VYVRWSAAAAGDRLRASAVFDKVLYFPHIRVPDNEWFTRALLYWDEVGTIVPPGPPHEVREILGEHTIALMNAGLVSEVKASSALMVPRFDEAFIELVETDPAIPRSSVTEAPWKPFQVYATKPGNQIAHYLESRGLLRRTGTSWLEVEERTADLLMTYLACTLAASQPVLMTPVTDRAESLAVLASDPAAPHAPATSVSQLEMTVLEGLLPAPAGGVSPKELAAFKDKHGELLRGFRREIETFALESTKLDPALRQRRAELFRDELADQLDEIRGRMKPQWPRIVFGTLCGVVAAAVPFATAVAGGAAVAAAGATPGLASAVYAAFGGDKADWQGSPVAYAALAQSRFSGSTP